MRLWDPATGQPTTTLKGHTSAVNSVAFSPDGRLLATADDNGTLRLWDACSPALVSQLRVGVPVTALAWGPRGIAVAGYQSLMHLAVIERG